MIDTMSSPVSDDLLDRLEQIPVAVLSDAMDALAMPSTILDPSIRRLCGKRMVGRARTVDRAPIAYNETQGVIGADLGMGTHAVIDEAAPRDIVVVAARGGDGAGIVGDNMAVRATKRGVVGFIVDGAVRDLDELETLGLNVYASATSPRQGVGRFVTLSVDKPIVVGSVRISPGDVLVGDRDGVAVLPSAKAREILEKAEAIEAVEKEIKVFLDGGNSLVASVKKYKQR